MRKKITAMAPGSEPIEKIVSDITQLIATEREYYRGILLSIRADLIKSRHEVHQIKKGRRGRPPTRHRPTLADRLAYGDQAPEGWFR